nr:kinase [Polymorphobacter sp.]
MIASEGLPPAYRDTVTGTWTPLAAHIAAHRRTIARPILIGISGVQGSGKSTACRFLEHLIGAHGLTAVTLSLDDLYFTRAERAGLAARVHPLFATRGVPGTHDLVLANHIITALLTSNGPVAIPRFDKATDDRAPETTWPIITAPVDILIFEGWCIGATPQPESALVAPVNALEAAEDAEMTWRTHANAALADGYARLFARIDLCVALRTPDFALVRTWRHTQEQRLRARSGPAAGMNEATLDRFIAHFERITRHMIATPPPAGAITIHIDRQQTAGAIQGLDRPAAATG